MFVVYEVFFAWNTQGGWLGSRGNQDMLCFKYLVLNLKAVGAGKTRLSMVGIDALVAEHGLVFFRHRIGKLSLEA
ncbi:hypothetical protein HSBAA_PA_2880 (plasmid) [Vreelandella sulfidaeris]|uniref:Uncharacterized protein n=1 Tax=Vreelandella sulfidaeris TaxID=115553 RepID=A0A455UHS1_9GAMM|nr:hypothetical protein HSBAA_PA_2880 [Halomonas sulfidaeris]